MVLVHYTAAHLHVAVSVHLLHPGLNLLTLSGCGGLVVFKQISCSEGFQLPTTEWTYSSSGGVIVTTWSIASGSPGSLGVMCWLNHGHLKAAQRCICDRCSGKCILVDTCSYHESLPVLMWASPEG